MNYTMQFGQARIPREIFLNIDFEYHNNIPWKEIVITFKPISYS